MTDTLTASQSSSSAIRAAICPLVNLLSLIIRACCRSSSGTIRITSSRLSNSTIIQPQCTPASQPQSACVTKCEPNCSTARSALSQVSYSFSSWRSSIIYRGMRGLLFFEMSPTGVSPAEVYRSLHAGTHTRTSADPIGGEPTRIEKNIGGQGERTRAGLLDTLAQPLSTVLRLLPMNV